LNYKHAGKTWEELAMILHENFTDSMGLERGSRAHLHFMALAIAGEAGELANLAKKDWRGYSGDELDKKELGKEMADIMIYLQILANIEGINLDMECDWKMQECMERWPEMFS
jgi:NTP pyrophosphatase (non-canonical NTP hydrolase)